jgi:hypothetical protein
VRIYWVAGFRREKKNPPGGPNFLTVKITFVGVLVNNYSKLARDPGLVTQMTLSSNNLPTVEI